MVYGTTWLIEEPDNSGYPVFGMTEYAEKPDLKDSLQVEFKLVVCARDGPGP